MTREEFTIGWVFLTVQPWGAIYDGRLEPDKARVQFELYYEALGYAHPEVWQAIAKQYAAGDHWPSMNDLLHDLRKMNAAFRIALPEPDYADALTPEEEAECEKTLSRILGKPFKLNHNNS